MEQIRFRFTGGISDESEMNFYEFGRFQYGAARFIYTVEKFRQSGRVLEKLRTRVDVDIRVKAAEEGSFIQDIIVATAPLLADCAVQCSFEAIFTHIWSRIIPPSKAKDTAVEIAKQETQRDRQTTLQEVHRTEQIRLMAEVANNNNATTQQALSILQDVITDGRSCNIQGQVLTEANLQQLKSELLAEMSREQIIHENREVLAQITPQLEDKLSSQLRKTISDITMPLRSSATDIGIYAGIEAQHPIAVIDSETARQISAEVEDENMTLLRGSIKAYDRENHNGKLRHNELPKPISFYVRSSDRQDMSTKILEAMGLENVWLRVYLIRDRYRVPIRCVLVGILTDEEFDNFTL